MKKITTRKLVESAILIAVATVLSLIKIDLPFGGGVTVVSMFPLILCSHRWGWKWGVVTAFVYSVLQLILGLDNVGYATSFGMALGIIFLDYILAYTVIGLSGISDAILRRKNAGTVAVGIAVTFCLRFLCHYITGVWIWGEWMPEEFMGLPMTSPWLYSFLYNGWYMLAELVLTEIVAMASYPALRRYYRGEDIRPEQAP